MTRKYLLNQFSSGEPFQVQFPSGKPFRSSIHWHVIFKSSPHMAMHLKVQIHWQTISIVQLSSSSSIKVQFSSRKSFSKPSSRLEYHFQRPILVWQSISKPSSHTENRLPNTSSRLVDYCCTPNFTLFFSTIVDLCSYTFMDIIISMVMGSRHLSFDILQALKEREMTISARRVEHPQLHDHSSYKGLLMT